MKKYCETSVVINGYNEMCRNKPVVECSDSSLCMIHSCDHLKKEFTILSNSIIANLKKLELIGDDEDFISQCIEYINIMINEINLINPKNTLDLNKNEPEQEYWVKRAKMAENQILILKQQLQQQEQQKQQQKEDQEQRKNTHVCSCYKSPSYSFRG